MAHGLSRGDPESRELRRSKYLSSLLDMPPEVDHRSSPGPRKALILVEVTSEGPETEEMARIMVV